MPRSRQSWTAVVEVDEVEAAGKQWYAFVPPLSCPSPGCDGGGGGGGRGSFGGAASGASAGVGVGTGAGVDRLWSTRVTVRHLVWNY